MLFNSIEYVVFLVSVVLAYFAAPYRYRVILLLVVSYYFYMRWRWEFIFLILAQTLITFEAGRQIGRASSQRVRRTWLTVAVVASIALLGWFKYFNFFNDSFSALFQAAGLNYLVPHLDIILPVGISFYTFQALSYVIDVYRGAHGVENSLTRYALYVAFFPQLVAGPIERATHLLDQFRRDNRFDIERMTEGVKLIAWGLFMKVVIADRLAIYVDRVYAAPELYSGSSLILATVFFAFQIYCDFAGYSCIAIGSARILGYDLMQNFRRPYFAHSISEFWQRWHISLTSWFRSYVYLPLGGNRVPYGRWLLNVLVVFSVSGLWHGANWTFIIWGALHAGYYLLESVGTKTGASGLFASVLPAQLYRVLGIGVTFCLVLVAWVFFRSASVDEAFFILDKMVLNWQAPIYAGPSQFTTLLSIGLIGVLLAVEYLQEKGYAMSHDGATRLPAIVRWPGYAMLLASITVLGLSSEAFIYFQF